MSDVRALIIVQSHLHLRAVQVVIHFFDAVQQRFKHYLSAVVDNGQSQVARQHVSQVLKLQGIVLHYIVFHLFRHHIRIAFQSLFQQVAFVLLFAVVLKHYQQCSKNGKERQKVQQKFGTVCQS